MKNKVDKNLLLSSNPYHYAFFLNNQTLSSFVLKYFFHFFIIFFLKKGVFERVPGILKNRGELNKKIFN